MDYTINTIDSKHFQLFQNERNLGELIYEKWGSIRATIKLENGQTFNLEPENFWSSKVQVKNGDENILELKLGWTGFIINLNTKDGIHKLLLKSKNILGSKYALINENEEELLNGEIDLQLTRFDYSFQTGITFENFVNKEVILLSILLGINYYLTLMRLRIA